MNSPIWVRKNIGNSKKKAGIPYPNPNKFTKWLLKTIGKPTEVDQVILIGLTMDCCLLCTAQELNFRGYKVSMLYEAVDSMDPCNEKYKKELASKSPILTWCKFIEFDELQKLIERK